MENYWAGKMVAWLAAKRESQWVVWWVVKSAAWLVVQ